MGRYLVIIVIDRIQHNIDCIVWRQKPNSSLVWRWLNHILFYFAYHFDIKQDFFLFMRMSINGTPPYPY